MLVLHHYQPLMAEAVAKFPSADEWQHGAEVGVPAAAAAVAGGGAARPAAAGRRLRRRGGRPRARADPPGRADVLRLPRVPDRRPADRATAAGRAHRRGARRGRRARGHRRGAEAATQRRPPTRRSPASGARPRAGRRRPWATSCWPTSAPRSSRSTRSDDFWMATPHSRCAATAASAASRSTSRIPTAMAILDELVATRRRRAAQHALRRGRARLGVDYESLRRDQARPRSTATPAASSTANASGLPGNDQTGAALAGPDWLDGGLDDDGIPLWPSSRSATPATGSCRRSPIVQALYHRDRTGEGQFVDTSIMYAHLLNTSFAWSRADGSRTGRPAIARRRCSSAGTRCTGCTRPPTAGCASPLSPTSTGPTCARRWNARTWRTTRASSPRPAGPPTEPRSWPCSTRLRRASGR